MLSLSLLSFIESIFKMFFLCVSVTVGFLDPEMKLFSHRILSRDECIDPFSKTGNLRNLFPCGDSMVCIIDDREDVWKFAPNLITVKKYIYFQGTGDINAPPGSKEAQQARKAGSQASRPAEASEAAGTSGPTAGPSGGSSASEERSNGRKKQRAKDHNNGGSMESTAPSASQEAAANERTQPDRGEAVEEGRGQGVGVGAEASMAAQVSDRTNVKEEVQGEEEDGSRTVGSGEEAPPPSSTPPGLHEPNSNLDFDLCSDSDSVTCKPPSSDSEGEYSQTRKSKQEGAEQVAVEEPSGGAGGKEEGDIKQKSTGENSSEVGGETSVLVLPPDPEQENGRSERREAETESQNSEQSGVTMEEEEKEEVDKDDHLIYLQEVLERIHREYYARYNAFLRKERPETPDIRKIVPELKARSLEGTTIVFSGLYPTSYPMERTRENYHAKALGAKIGKGLMLSSKDPGRTTHLIAARAGELLHTELSESIHTP
uniref:protein-serine/threonine phosphatase n=1 Tax=Hucho hucho TaxID=62062 RepID=A0A4W5QFY3_9TELE